MGRPLATNAARIRRRAGDRNDRHVMADGERDQAKAGVGDAGHAGVGDERDFGAAFEVDDQFGGLGHLVVFVVADGARLDTVVGEKFLRLARVFAGDQVNFFEHAQGAEGDVFEIADGRGDQVESRAGAEGAAVVPVVSGWVSVCIAQV